MIDYGYRKKLSLKPDKELIRMVEVQHEQYHKKAILDAQNILFERGISFNPLFPDEINAAFIKEELSYTDESLWNFAFEKKKEGLSYSELLSLLTEKGVNATEAVLTLKRLPEIQHTNEDFDAFIIKQYKTQVNGAFATSVILSLILLPIVLTNNSIHFAIPSVLFAIIIFLLISTSIKTGGYIGSRYWVNLIKEHPEEIVWIKPIIEKVTAGYVITLSKTKKYQLITKKDKKLEITWRTDEENRIFTDGIRKLLPHAQFGYSSDISMTYYRNPEKFIENLKVKKLYTPIDNFQL